MTERRKRMTLANLRCFGFRQLLRARQLLGVANDRQQFVLKLAAEWHANVNTMKTSSFFCSIGVREWAMQGQRMLAVLAGVGHAVLAGTVSRARPLVARAVA